ncbi:MAG: isochorismatase family protein [Ramlibacter sp.]
MLLDLEDSQLLLVDYQIQLMPAIHDHGQVLANALRLARIAQLLQVPVWGTEQNPAGLGRLVPELRSLTGHVVEKMHFSACTDGLGNHLRPLARQQQGGNARSLPRHLQKAIPVQAPSGNTIVVSGCEAHVCLLQTALDLLEEEFEVWVVADACGSRSERNRDAAFDRLVGAGAELVTTEMVAFEWLRTAEHPLFKQVLALLK